MADESPPPREIIRTGYETRDLSVPLVFGAAIVLIIFGMVLHIALWQVSIITVPEQKHASPPVVMPGEDQVNDRIRAVPQPRLEPLEPLAAEPPSFRSSRPLPNGPSFTQRPEDLRANRQPLLNSPAWIEKGKVARIPINVAMDAVIEAERAKTTAKKGGSK